MLERSRAAAVKYMIITGGSLKESKGALALAQEHSLYATVGCHPTRSSEFDKYRDGPDAYLAALNATIEANLKGKGRVVAVGECGLGTSAFCSPVTADADLTPTRLRSYLFRDRRGAARTLSYASV